MTMEHFSILSSFQEYYLTICMIQCLIKLLIEYKGKNYLNLINLLNQALVAFVLKSLAVQLGYAVQCCEDVVLQLVEGETKRNLTSEYRQ